MHANQPLRILLIEDNPGDISLIRKNLDLVEANYVMDVFSDGESALNHLRNMPEDPSQWPHLVLLDLNLPRVSGAEILAYIKNSEMLKFLPVVIFTSSTQDSDILETYGHNANCFVEKPSNLDDYQNVVKTVWDFWSHTARLPNESPQA